MMERTPMHVLMIGVAMLTCACKPESGAQSVEMGEQPFSVPENPSILLFGDELNSKLHSLALTYCEEFRQTSSSDIAKGAVAPVIGAITYAEADRCIRVLSDARWQEFDYPVVVYSQMMRGVDGIDRFWVHGLDITRTPGLCRLNFIGSHGDIVTIDYDFRIEHKQAAYIFGLMAESNVVSWDELVNSAIVQDDRDTVHVLSSPNRLPFCLDVGVHAVVSVENRMGHWSNAVEVQFLDMNEY